MRTSKGFYVILFIVAVLFISSCAPMARYTYDEIKHYPLDIQELIMKGEVTIDMTPSQVRYAWGPPHSTRILEPVGDKRREEWVYTKLLGIVEERRLLFVDGKLIYISPGHIKLK